MKILMIDNYDSFTYNLVQMLERISGNTVQVVRNDKILMEEVGDFDKIILSPGPGLPAESGCLLSLIENYAATKSIFGVCLGMQAIGEVFGAKLKNILNVHHGVATPCIIQETKSSLFSGVESGFMAGRYHSWIVNDVDLPKILEVTARDEKGQIMALQHKEYDVQGVQFHPESVLTPDGEQILINWINN